MSFEQFMPKPKKYVSEDFGEYYLKPFTLGEVMKLKYAGDEEVQLYKMISYSLCDKDGTTICTPEQAEQIDIGFMKEITEHISQFNGITLQGELFNDPL